MTGLREGAREDMTGLREGAREDMTGLREGARSRVLYGTAGRPQGSPLRVRPKLPASTKKAAASCAAALFFYAFPALFFIITTAMAAVMSSVSGMVSQMASKPNTAGSTSMNATHSTNPRSSESATDCFERRMDCK